MPKLEAVKPGDAPSNRERLLNAAREVLAEHGFDADVTEILKEAGVGAGTLYRHFPSKEALIRAVAEEMNSKTVRELNEALASVVDAREALAKTMQVGFERVKEYGQLAITLVAGTQPPAYDGVVDRQGLANYFSAILYRGIAEGQFRQDVDVEYIVAVWFSLVAPPSLRQLMEKRSLDAISASTTNFLLSGLSKPQSG